MLDRSELKPAARESVVGLAELSHGTCEQVNLTQSKRFLQEVLQLRCVRHGEPAQMLAGRNDITVVAVGMGKAADQEYANRWILAVPDAGQVADTRKRALARQDLHAIKQIGELMEADGESSVSIQDADGNWWQVTNRPVGYYQSIFKRGDV